MLPARWALCCPLLPLTVTGPPVGIWVTGRQENWVEGAGSHRGVGVGGCGQGSGPHVNARAWGRGLPPGEQRDGDLLPSVGADSPGRVGHVLCSQTWFFWGLCLLWGLWLRPPCSLLKRCPWWYCHCHPGVSSMGLTSWCASPPRVPGLRVLLPLHDWGSLLCVWGSHDRTWRRVSGGV